MYRPIRAAMAVTGVSAVVSLFLGVNPAEAVTCTKSDEYTSADLAASAKFYATSGCDGVYAGTAATHADEVRGRFYKDWEWQTSAYGWVKVFTTEDGFDKVIGNTVTDRAIKGQERYFTSQKVSYLY